MTTLSEVEKITVKDYDDNACFRQRNGNYWLPEIRVFGSLLTAGRVLEIGCGNGAEGESFADSGFTYVGTDISLGYLAEAKRLRPHLEFLHMSAYSLEFADNAFDGIWAGNVLYHIPKSRIDEALKEVVRVVRPGGLVFITLPVGDCEEMKRKISCGGYDSYRLFSMYREDNARAAFSRNGLEVELLSSKQSNSSGRADEVYEWLVFYLRVRK